MVASDTIQLGATSCRPDLPPCDATARGGCPNLQTFAKGRVRPGERLTFATVFIPHRGNPATAQQASSVLVDMSSRASVVVDLGLWAVDGKTIHVDLGNWSWHVV